MQRAIIKDRWAALFVVALLVTSIYAGTTGFNSLVLAPTAGETNSLLVYDSSLTEQVKVTAAGAVTIAGTLGVTGVLDLGTAVPTMATSRTAVIHMYELSAQSSTGAEELKNTKATIGLADASADELIYVAWALPDDFDKTNSYVDVKVTYLCDNATVTEGEWNVQYLAVAPDDADAALGNEIAVVDTPVQNQWMQTPPMVIPASAIGATDEVLYLSVYHDVSDPLCNAQDVNVLSIQLGYTTDTNY